MGQQAQGHPARGGGGGLGFCPAAAPLSVEVPTVPTAWTCLDLRSR